MSIPKNFGGAVKLSCTVRYGSFFRLYHSMRPAPAWPSMPQIGRPSLRAGW
jgi:hypothetical protein